MPEATEKLSVSEREFGDCAPTETQKLILSESLLGLPCLRNSESRPCWVLMTELLQLRMYDFPDGAEKKRFSIRSGTDTTE